MAPVALITQIASLSSHDGPGVRTTLFFKGCSLRCHWCHNPETICSLPELEWQKRLCIGCRQCVEACLFGAVRFSGAGAYPVAKELCTRCGKCTEVCPSGALQLTGKRYTVPLLVNRVLKDEKLIRAMNGGITFSGGEPALQAAFIKEVAVIFKERSLHTALDTCGQAPRAAYNLLLPFMDLLLFDIKEIDTRKHTLFTGSGNEIILDNLLYIADRIRKEQLPVQLWIRTPLIPGATATEENMQGIGRFISDHLADLVKKWELCAFNTMCATKYEQLGMEWRLADKSLLSSGALAVLLKTARAYAPAIDQVTSSGLCTSNKI